MKSTPLKKIPSNETNKSSSTTKTLVYNSLAKWKRSNQIWVKNQEFFQKYQPMQPPSLEISVSKKGTFNFNTHKRILVVYSDQIICFKVYNAKL